MTIRFGVLGCARIAPLALLRPARKLDGVEVVAVGSRSLERAEKWARRHRVPAAYGSYDEVLADERVDAVFIPLPNSLHAEWAVRALEAGKHVLCEKPLAAHELQARRMTDAAAASGLVAVEAFHYRYHPVTDRVHAIVGSGELGELRRIDLHMSVPVLLPRDIRWDAELAGGAVMDVGCYMVNYARLLAGGEPEVLTASGTLTRGGVDRSFEARLAFPKGVEARVRGSILGPLWARLEVTGTRGTLRVLNPIAPQFFYRMTVKVDGAERSERTADGTTYGHQLAAFAAAVRGEAPAKTPFSDAVGNARILDRVRALIGVRTP